MIESKTRRRTARSLWALAAFLIFPGLAAAQSYKIDYIHTDHVGSPVAVTSSSASVTWTVAYSAYGKEYLGSGTPDHDPIGFAGSHSDRASGLSYMQARYFDPDIGRFLSIDPVDFQIDNVHSFNRYAYASNNPYRYVDPDGESILDIGMFAKDVGNLLVTEIVYVAAVIRGDDVVAAMAIEDMRAQRVDAAVSTIGLVNPVPGTSAAYRTTRMANQVDNAADIGRNVPVPSGAVDDIPVIGRQVDTNVAKDWPGHRILADPNWTLAKNDEWIQQIITRRERVYVGSPQNRSNVWDSVNNRETVFGRELRQLQEAGYTWDGDYLIPPVR